MAKANYSPLSQWKGRAGGQVYRVREGKQIVSAYQPNVTNPRSQAQLEQRAKFALMSRLSSLTPDAAIVGFGGSKANRRAKYTSNIIRNAFVRAIPDPTDPMKVIMTGNIANGDLLFSIGPSLIPNPNVFAISLNTGAGVQVEIDTTLALSEIMLIDVFGESQTAGVDEKYVSIFHRAVPQADFAEVQAFEGVGYHRLYAIPIGVNELVAVGSPNSGAVTNYTDTATPGAGVQVVTQSLQRTNADLIYGRSIFLGEYTVTAE